MNRQLLILLILFATTISLAPVSGVDETVYFEERFENKSTGSVVYQTDFESGTAGWRGWMYNYYGPEESIHRQIDSDLQTTVQGAIRSGRDPYYLYQERSIEIPEEATYHLYVRADAGFPEAQFDDRVNYDQLEVANRELALEQGRETHHAIDLSAGSYAFKRAVQYTDTDGGRVNGSATIDRLTILRETRRYFGIWESDGFPMYTDAGIDGSSLFARSVTARINATPAQDNDPVVIAFDVRTSSESANWSIEQSGHTIATGSIGADHSRRIKRTISLQTGQFTLGIDSRDTVALDNVRVLGYNGHSSGRDRLQPAVPVIDRAAAKSGYDTLLGSLYGVFDLGLDTATYLALVGLGAGSVLFVVGRRGDDRGLLLVAGAGTLLISVLVFTPLLNTVAWVFTGSTDQPSLEEPDVSAPSVLYRDEFDAGSVAASDWRQVSGPSSDAYVDTTDGGHSTLVLREGATVETTVPVDRSGVDSAVVTVEASVQSGVDQAPPDKDALTFEVESDDETLIEDSSAVVAAGGDTADGTVQQRVGLSGSTVTIRLGARDTNGGDDRARVDVSRVLLRGAP
jgi:hypothetical protein